MEQQKEPPQEPLEPAAGHSCPECGTPRRADNTPSCVCGTRASDALREARTAQAAAAEDFDPLRIRPYVDLDDHPGRTPAPGTGPAPAPGTGGSAPAPGTGPAPASATPATGTPLAPGTAPAPDAPGTPSAPGVPSAPGTAPSPGAETPASPTPPPGAPVTLAPASATGSTPPGRAPAPDEDATMTLRAVGAVGAGTGGSAPTEATSVLPTPLAPSAGAPSAHDLRLFEPPATAPAGPGPDGTSDGRPPRRRRRGVLLSAAGALVVVVGAAGFASGLFSYESPSRDGALPDEVRASVPDPSADAVSAVPVPSPSSARPTSSSPSPSASASPSASESASPSPSASSASATPSPSAEPTQTETTTPTEDPTRDSEDDGPDRDGGSPLHRGDRGPEVAELQQRLAQLYLYTGDIDGTYNHRVEDSVRTYQWARGIRSDELGVYGQDTRSRLESETREP
ncbi:peptidoglycan-binding protein [Streptomyces sp. NPDC056568]|uniref:peptidoglycan-binding domain-containing protein n=1 Tax=Streptomyces sp. NPDC056568 TaxID=3345866 RepID=UPI0036C3CCAD